MWMKVAVEGPSDRKVEMVEDVRQEGEIGDLISRATGEYRKLYPDAEPFEFALWVGKA
jgi:hypothetical protein